MSDAIARPLSGKIVLVTGAGQRLGKEIALGLGRLGADVAVHFHASRAGAGEGVSAIKADGNRAGGLPAGVNQPEPHLPPGDAGEGGSGGGQRRA